MRSLALDSATAIQLSRAYRLQSMGLTVDGQPFDLYAGYQYLTDILDLRAPRKTILKGAQMGFTSACIFDAALSAATEKLRGILYLFPRDTDVYDFSRARFGPNVASNPEFAALVQKTDSAGLKCINGVQIYFRAAGVIGSSSKHSLAAVKGIPADRLYLDERDEMLDSRVDAAEHRLDASTCPQITSLSTPLVPGYGVDLEYKDSDQRTWHWRCQRCKQWTCLDQTWPDCIAEPMGEEPYYLCSHCRHKLDRIVGESIPAHPDRSKDHLGWWISQLNRRPAEAIVAEREKAESRGRMREFFNQVLARPYAEIEDKLTKEMLDDCLTEEPRGVSAEGPTCAGADPGVGKIHYYIKQRIGDRDSQTLTYGLCDGFDELAQLSRKFHVQVGCIDQMAETHAVRRFIDSHPSWWGVRYVGRKKGLADWDLSSKTVTIERDQALDASHYKFLEKRERLPAPDERYHDLLIPQLCNMARIRTEDKQTGEIRYRWVVLGGQKNDHLKHCHGYATLAEERVALAGHVSRARQRRTYDDEPRVAVF